jgi:uncharacterized membrane protein (DUF485 family)
MNGVHLHILYSEHIKRVTQMEKIDSYTFRRELTVKKSSAGAFRIKNILYVLYVSYCFVISFA